MFGQFGFRWMVLAAVCVGITLLFVPASAKLALASSVILDDFSSTLCAQAPGTVPCPSTNDGAASGAFGGRHRIIVTASSPSILADSNVTALDKYSHNGSSGVFGSSTIQWDGTPGNTFNPTGISPTDLTDGGTNSGIIIAFTFSDLSVPMTFRYYSSATNCSEVTVNTPGGLSTSQVPKLLFLPWASFSACAGFSAADNTNVTAAELYIDSTGTDGMDLTLEFVAAGALDYGDQPDTYMTLEASSGPAHFIPSIGGIKMGSYIDDELDGQPTGWASGDDKHPAAGPDDEDGFVPVSGNWANGTSVTFNIPTSADGCINGWADWNSNGLFAETTGATGEKFVVNFSATAGNNNITKTIPSSATGNGTYHVRFRFTPRMGPSGTSCSEVIKFYDEGGIHYLNGEIEDHYLVNGTPTAVTLDSLVAKMTKGNKVRLKWETGNELNVIGFNVWRKQGKTGWKQRNASLIEAQNPGGLAGAKYKFVDKDARAKAKYKLEAIMNDGTSSWSGIVKVRAK